MHVDVYGNDHSPWVQAVLLGLHDKRIEHTRTTVPPLPVFLKSGVYMPAVRIDGGPWLHESDEILQHIGYGQIWDADLKAIRGAWRGVLHRTDNAFRFWHAFSLASDPHPNAVVRTWRNVLRSFTIFYFFLLIRFAVFRQQPEEPSSYGDQFMYWEEKLARSSGAFIDGDTPGIRDMLLFGIVQCHCSIEVPAVAALVKDPRLGRVRAWIASMQQRFHDYQDNLYSRRFFADSGPAPTDAGTIDRAGFWVGAALMFAAFPVTVPLVAFFANRIRRREGS